MSLLCDVLFSAQSRCSSTLIRLQRCQFVANKRPFTVHSWFAHITFKQIYTCTHVCLWSNCRQLPATFLVLPALRLKSFARNDRPPSSEPIPHGKILAFELVNPRTAYGWKQPHTASNTNSRSKQNQESMQTLNHFICQTPDLVFAFSGCVQRVTAWYPFDHDFIADHCWRLWESLPVPGSKQFSDRSKRTRTLEAFGSFSTKLHYRRRPKFLHRGQRFVRALYSNTCMSRILFNWMPHRAVLGTSCTANTFWARLCKTLAFELLVYAVIGI